MKTIVGFAPAKVNLSLDIVGVRENGYHEMDMVMQAVSLGDTITIETTDTPGEIRFVCDSMGGVTTVSSVTLLTAMAEAGEIDKAYLPDRLALIDPYVGIYGDQTLKIAWSGKSIENFRESYLLGIQYYKKISGGVVEFYVNSEVGVVPYMVI